jgi:DNA-binding phage protein
MPRRYHKVDSLLRSVQDAVAQRHTNAYQIAKATGLPLRSVQKLLRQTNNPTLRNVEVILSGLGLSLYLQADGAQTIKPAKRARPPEARGA